MASVHNSGGRALDVSGTMLLSAGPGGLNAGPFAVTLGTTLAIGSTEPITTVLDQQVPNGPWDVEITLRSGLLSRTVRATVTFPDSGASLPVATRPEPERRSMGLATGLGVVVVVGGLVVLFRHRKHKPVVRIAR